MGTSQTINQIQAAIGDIDMGIQELDGMKMAISMEAQTAGSEFDSGQGFSQSINAASTCIEDAIAELKKTRASLQGVASALR